MSDLDYAVKWLDEHRSRLHSDTCSVRIPSVQCSCGLHAVLTDVREANNALIESASQINPSFDAALEKASKLFIECIDHHAEEERAEMRIAFNAGFRAGFDAVLQKDITQ